MLVHTANGSTGAEGTCLETKLPSVPANLLKFCEVIMITPVLASVAVVMA